MEAEKLAVETEKIVENLPKPQKSVRPLPSEKTSVRGPKQCDKCHNADAKGFIQDGENLLNVCDPCGIAIHKAQEQEKREKQAEELIPKLFSSARMEKLSEQLQAKLESLPKDMGVLLWGSQGVGKSYAMVALMRDFILKGFKVARITYEMFCLQLRNTYKPGSTTTELDIIEPLQAADKLFIEDVGTTVSSGKQESDFSLRTFYVLLEKRLESCKPTFITTNKNVEELGKSFDARIASRLQQACEVIHLTGQDRRTAKRA